MKMLHATNTLFHGSLILLSVVTAYAANPSSQYAFVGSSSPLMKHSNYLQTTMEDPSYLVKERHHVLPKKFNFHHSSRIDNLLSLQMVGGEAEKAPATEQKELTPDTVVEMIEVTFVNACLQLSKGYVDVLKLFIVSLKTAFGMGLTVPDLIQKLEAHPIQSANRPLMNEEVKLRATWMNIIFMILENLDENNNEDYVSTVEDGTRQMYDDYVKYITDWRKAQDFSDRDAAAMVTELKVQSVLDGCSSAAAFITDPMDKAMLPQNLRVALLTLTVIEEEKRCFDDKLPPQPPIPGTK